MNIDGSFTPLELEQERATIIRRLLTPTSLRRPDRPQAILLGGQSGAGKTTLHRVCEKRLGNNTIVINGDEYRSKHPRFEALKEAYGDDWVSYTAAWSGKLVEGLIDTFSRMGYNLVIEGTLRTSTVPLKTADLLRSRGYDVSLALMAVKPEISLISCQIRYEQMRVAGTTPRATDPAHHARIVQDIASNLDELEHSGSFTGIRLYSRAGTCLWASEGDDDQSTPTRKKRSAKAPESASEALRSILFGPWTEEERFHYDHLQQQLETLKGTQSQP